MSKSIQLINYCTEVSIIECHEKGCKSKMTINEAATEAVDHFYKTGWRVKKGVCLCPKHSK